MTKIHKYFFQFYPNFHKSNFNNNKLKRFNNVWNVLSIMLFAISQQT